MKKYFFIPVLTILLFSCKKEVKSVAPVIQMQSEMSALMNRIYELNEDLKQKIIKGEGLSEFPEEFLNIHTATLTDPSDRTSEFNAFSELFLYNQRLVFETSKDSLKNRFNQSINSCIACHQNACPGPIPRIKKLLIR